MSSEFPEGGAAPAPDRRPGRSGDGGAPVTGALAIVLAVVAVVAGFLILRTISGDDNGGAISPGPGTGTTQPGDGPDGTQPIATEPTTTTTTLPPDVFDGATVVVANANGVDGSAGQMSRALDAAGFTLGDAVNASFETGQIDASLIYYDPSNDAARAVAETLDRLTGGDSAISPLPDPIPTRDGALEGDVLFLLGNDKAGRTLEELAPAADDGLTPVTSPDVAGGDPDDPGSDPDDPGSDDGAD